MEFWGAGIGGKGEWGLVSLVLEMMGVRIDRETKRRFLGVRGFIEVIR
jgi:hypothetical protein